MFYVVIPSITVNISYSLSLTRYELATDLLVSQFSGVSTSLVWQSLLAWSCPASTFYNNNNSAAAGFLLLADIIFRIFDMIDGCFDSYDNAWVSFKFVRF